MPSYLHEVLIELFRQRAAMVADLMEVLGVKVPAWHKAEVVVAGELHDLAPTQRVADAVVTLTDAKKRPRLAVVVEVQLRPDRDKRYTWPTYVTNLRARVRCPVVLLVVCANRRTAAWCGVPIKLGHPDFVLTPLVIGPDQVPVVTDAEQARTSPELTVMSALAHGGRPDHSKVLDSLLVAYGALDGYHASLYHDVVLGALPAAARRYLEELVAIKTYEYQSDFARRYFGQGKAEGKAEGEAEGEVKALLAVLATRCIEVPDDARTRITACTDLDQLETWIRRAVTATSVDEVFG